MIRNLFGGYNDRRMIDSRTIDIFDVFGDGSCVALYRLDGNANDTSGNYHGTETDITYGGGVYGRGAVFNGITSKITTMLSTLNSANIAVSFNVKPKSVSETAAVMCLILDSKRLDIVLNSTSSNAVSCTTNSVFINHATLLDGDFHNICVNVNYAINTVVVYYDGAMLGTASVVPYTQAGTCLFGKSGGGYYYTGSLDQVRIFNRNITQQEAYDLYSEKIIANEIGDVIDVFGNSSCKAFYKWDGNILDETGTYNATPVSYTPTYVTGRFGQSVRIDTGRLTLNIGSETTSKVLMSSTSSYSVSCWMKKVDGVRNVIASRYNSSAYGEAFFMEPTGAFTYGTASAITTATNSTSPTQTILDDGKYHHVVLVVNRAVLKSYIYIDGNLFYTGTALASAYDNGLATLVGAFYSSYYSGEFDEHRFFNRALTPSEVAALYSTTMIDDIPMAEKSDPFHDNSGVALYRFEGNINDEQGDYNGKVAGGSSYTYPATINGRSYASSNFDTYINIANLGSWFAGKKAATVCMRMKPRTSGSTFQFCISHATHSSPYYEFAMTLTTTSAVSFISAYPTARVSYSGTFDSKTYYDMVVTFGNSISQLYIDGVLVATGTAPAAIGATYSTACLGRIPAYNSPTYASIVSCDRLRVFNRVLTADEIQTLYINQA